MKPSSLARTLPMFVLLALGGCKTAELNSAGARVATVRAPLGTECQPVGYFVGKGGGTFGGGLVSNESLIEFAMNDVRNKAAQQGATHVHIDPPQLGQGDGTTTTATVTGTGYKCPASFAAPGTVATGAAPPATPAPAAPSPAAGGRATNAAAAASPSPGGF